MSITGTVRSIGGGNWAVESSYPANSTPELITIAWKVTGMARRGMGPAPEFRDGLEVQHVGSDQFQAYAHGAYLVLMTEHEGTSRTEPLPVPRVRGEVRYRMGRWEKLTKRQGWVPA